jgi:hypothetical protein
LKEPATKERRSDKDRRKHLKKFSTLFLFSGKRKKLRRIEDYKKITKVDWYHPTLLIHILIILGLSLLDAALTLVLLNEGAVEINPVMRYYINHGPSTFVMVKYGLTALALIIMVALHTSISVRYRTLASLMFPSCILLFGSVIVWELYLLTKLSPV